MRVETDLTEKLSAMRSPFKVKPQAQINKTPLKLRPEGVNAGLKEKLFNSLDTNHAMLPNPNSNPTEVVIQNDKIETAKAAPTSSNEYVP